MYDAAREQTDGLQMTPFQLAEKLVDVNFWDFGGQVEYETTHELFLTVRSVLRCCAACGCCVDVCALRCSASALCCSCTAWGVWMRPSCSSRLRQCSGALSDLL